LDSLHLTVFGSLVGDNLLKGAVVVRKKQIEWPPRGKWGELGPSRRSANTWGWHTLEAGRERHRL